MFDEQLVTVWSAPNYCYRCGNFASIMTVHEDGSRTFNVYDAAPENAKDKGQGRRLVWTHSSPIFHLNNFFYSRICNILYNDRTSNCTRNKIFIRF